MSLCKRPTHWLPQNPLSFIINKLVLIIEALLHTMHVLYMRERKRHWWKRRMRETRDIKEEKWLAWEPELRCGNCKRRFKKKRRFWTRERRGWDLSPVAPIQSISISSSLSSPSHHTLPLPLFIFLLKCSNFYGLRENRERERERGGGCRGKPMIVRGKCDWFEKE